MGDYTITMRRSPHISDEEARRRLAAVYRLLLDLAAKSKRDAPAESAETGAGAPDGESVADRQVQCTPEPVSAQVAEV